jgi:hypothetical protein
LATLGVLAVQFADFADDSIFSTTTLESIMSLRFYVNTTLSTNNAMTARNVPRRNSIVALLAPIPSKSSADQPWR